MTSLTKIADRLADEIQKMDDGNLFEILSEGGGKGQSFPPFLRLR